MADPAQPKPPPARRSVMRRAARVVGAGAFGAAVLGLVGTLALAVMYRQNVVVDPGPHLERKHIRGIIAQESPVYFRDGETRVGVFFEAEHRQYVAWEDLPLPWVMGIVAAEDGGFFGHPGVDIRGIARAMRDNLRAGTLVAGGSTLTQQTAKNIYYRPDRSIRAKGVELVNALRLEAHYGKTEILTFYANQFHVSGNGRGLGIGARHFFDKEVEDLTVVEAAFLAGLVKAPSRYDPFLGDEARRERAVAKGHDRTRYVLSRLVEVEVEQLVGPAPRGSDPAALEDWNRRLAAGRAVQVEAAALLAEGFELPFRRGTFRYDASAVLDEVARRLTEPPFDQVLLDAGIDDPATSGVQVITTLDPPAQAAATYGLWHHLTEAGLQLEPQEPTALLLEGRGPRFDPDRPPIAGEFRRGTVTAEREVSGKRTLDVDLGGHSCHVDREALVRIAAGIAKGQAGSRSKKTDTAGVDALVDALPAGSVVQISVRDVSDDGATCDLEWQPTVQGAVMVVEGGEIRAMIGGNDNKNFNRATAVRQMGSTWKPLVFHAALELGWSPDDVLDNRRNVFPFSTTFYYPRPDHEPEPSVSMSWAGVNSENLASIWLLYHLVDRLDTRQIANLAESLDLARRVDEDEKAYRLRIQKAGVLPTRGRLVEARFLQARREALKGLDSSEHPEDALSLQSLLLGWGHSNERQRVGSEGQSVQAWKQRALDNSWRHLQPMMKPCVRRYRVLSDALKHSELPDPERVEDLTVLLDGDAIRVACGAIPEGYVLPDQDFLDSLRLSTGATDVDADEEESGETTEEPWVRIPWLERLRFRVAKGPQVVEESDLLIDDRLHLSTLQELEAAIERREAAGALRDKDLDLYDPQLLYWHPDFRVLLALRYVSSLAEQYGVQTEIPPVLSLPLGATEITLEEATSVYGGLVSGGTWTYPGHAGGRLVPTPSSPALLIAEIRDIDGNVLYQAAPSRTTVVKPATSEMTAHILRNVVRFGTGRRALAVTEGGKQVPVGGKTGTTNEYRNAAFLGFAPVWAAGSFRPADGYAVGVYVGYDDNAPLVNKNVRLAGSSGALPAWVSTVDGLRAAGLLGEPSEFNLLGGSEKNEWNLAWSSGLTEVPVDPERGLVLDEPDPDAGEDAPTVLIPRRVEMPDVRYRPFHRPPKIFPRTDEWEGGI